MFISGGNHHLISRFCGVALVSTTIFKMVSRVFWETTMIRVYPVEPLSSDEKKIRQTVFSTTVCYSFIVVSIFGINSHHEPPQPPLIPMNFLEINFTIRIGIPNPTNNQILRCRKPSTRTHTLPIYPVCWPTRHHSTPLLSARSAIFSDTVFADWLRILPWFHVWSPFSVLIHENTCFCSNNLFFFIYSQVV